MRQTPRCGWPASRAVSRPACADEKNSTLSVDRTLLGTSTIGPHPARPVPDVAPHDPPRQADAGRSAIGRPIHKQPLLGQSQVRHLSFPSLNREPRRRALTARRIVRTPAVVGGRNASRAWRLVPSPQHSRQRPGGKQPRRDRLMVTRARHSTPIRYASTPNLPSLLLQPPLCGTAGAALNAREHHLARGSGVRFRPQPRQGGPHVATQLCRSLWQAAWTHADLAEFCR